MTEEQTSQSEQEELVISDQAFVLVEKLLEVARQVEVQELEQSEIDYLEQNELPPAKYYKQVATIDIEHDDNIDFHQGIMLLVDVLTHIQDDHPEIIVSGEDEKSAEIKLVAETRESLDNIPYEDADKFIAEAKQRRGESA